MKFVRTCIKFAVCLLLPGKLAWEAAAQEMSEYRLKSSFIYNFITFTDWTDKPQSTLTLCLYSGNPFNGYLEEINNKVVAGKTLGVQELMDASKLGECDIVYIDRSVFEQPDLVLQEMARHDVLTIADSPNALDHDVVINMVRQNNKVAFDINMDMARAKNIRFSSRLLQLANELVGR